MYMVKWIKAGHLPIHTAAYTVQYSHSFAPVLVVELHVVASLDPPYSPGLLPGHWRYQDPSWSPEVWGPVPEHHARGLVDAGGVRIDGGGHFENGDALSEILGFTPDTVYAAHGHI